MRAHPLVVITVFVVAIVIGSALEPWARGSIAIAAAIGAGAFLVGSRCTHRHATLLPPVHDGGPERDHARWYCDQCGRTWAAAFTSDTRPRLIYDGFDELKAVRAAARAETLEKERRRLAGRRAGWAQTQAARAAAPARPGPRPLEAVPMRRARE